jgi:hypothetical protein
VNIARNGKLVLAVYADGTVRWHRLSDGEELLALFVHNVDRRWVAWTPKGYYMASVGAETPIGWHVNQGWDKAAQFYPGDNGKPWGESAPFPRPGIRRSADHGYRLSRKTRKYRVKSTARFSCLSCPLHSGPPGWKANPPCFPPTRR